MFGYVKADKGELKISEYDTYKAVYCSICRQLGKEYGIFAKFILSYDFTFLAMLRLSVADECMGYKNMRCPFNPMKKCVRLDKYSEELSYTCACLIILFYYKMRDNLADSGFFGRLKTYLIYPIFAHYRKKTLKIYGNEDKRIGELMQMQASLEKSDTKSLDFACEPTAKMLEFIFARDKDKKSVQRVLEHAGYCAGKWIYLVDAVDDLESDIKNRGFNPLLFKYSDAASAKEGAKMLINNCNVELANSFELLELKRYKSILSNIIYLGMPKVLKNITDNKENKK